ncbi:MAG TPA: hypothetical protein VFV34_20530, partial [Blastocatellia bacterium]|nr:hypothetical protein [Blastocatellia bacterium]
KPVSPAMAKPAGSKTNPAQIDITPNGMWLSAGQQVDGLTIVIARGAAQIDGRVLLPKSMLGSKNVHLCLVPASLEHQNDPLWYPEAPVKWRTGEFSLPNIPPGKYWIALIDSTFGITARPSTLPLMMIEAGRSRARHEAESAKIPIELRPCQRLTEYEVKYPEPIKR